MHVKYNNFGWKILWRLNLTAVLICLSKLCILKRNKWTSVTPGPRIVLPTSNSTRLGNQLVKIQHQSLMKIMFLEPHFFIKYYVKMLNDLLQMKKFNCLKL